MGPFLIITSVIIILCSLAVWGCYEKDRKDCESKTETFVIKPKEPSEHIITREEYIAKVKHRKSERTKMCLHYIDLAMQRGKDRYCYTVDGYSDIAEDDEFIRRLDKTYPFLSFDRLHGDNYSWITWRLKPKLEVKNEKEIEKA